MEIITPDYPEGLFPLKLLGKELSMEVARLKSICEALNIEIISIDRVSYISNQTKPILEKAVLSKKSGASVDYNTTTTTTKVIQPQKVKKDALTPALPPPIGELVVRDGITAGATPEQFFQMLMEVMRQQQQQQPPPPISPIQQQRELRDAADNGFLLSAEQLANIFRLKKSSISSWKSGSKRLGFQFTKIKENNISLWKVEQY